MNYETSLSDDHVSIPAAGVASLTLIPTVNCGQLGEGSVIDLTEEVKVTLHFAPPGLSVATPPHHFPNLCDFFLAVGVRLAPSHVHRLIITVDTLAA